MMMTDDGWWMVDRHLAVVMAGCLGGCGEGKAFAEASVAHGWRSSMTETWYLMSVNDIFRFVDHGFCQVSRPSMVPAPWRGWAGLWGLTSAQCSISSSWFFCWREFVDSRDGCLFLCLGYTSIHWCPWLSVEEVRQFSEGTLALLLSSLLHGLLDCTTYDVR